MNRFDENNRKNKLVIVGHGGFAREVAWMVERINANMPVWDFLGFIDSSLNVSGVVGGDDFVMGYKGELYVAIAIGSSGAREKIYKKYKENPYVKFANLIDPGALLSDKVRLGEGNIICAGSILTVDIQLGNCNILNLGCTVGHDVVMKDFVTINPGVNVSGNVFLGSCANIGTGTQIIQGLHIGKRCVIGAGAVVNKNLPDDCTAVGVPAKIIKTGGMLPIKK